MEQPEIDLTPKPSKKHLLELIKNLEKKISMLEAENIKLLARISVLELNKIYPIPEQPRTYPFYYPNYPGIWCKSQL